MFLHQINNEETKRFDSEYFKNSYLKSIDDILDNNHFILNEKCIVKGGKRLPKGTSFSEAGTHYLRAQNLKSIFADVESSPLIDQKTKHILRRYTLQNNDVVMTIVGSIGDVGILKSDIYCNLTENCVKITSGTINPDYLLACLMTKHLQTQIEREAVGTNQGKLAIERIKRFILPLLSNEFQDSISDIIETSWNKLNEAKTLYSQAEDLLIEEIGINVDNIDTGALQVKSFKKTFAKTGRLDAEYYQGKYDELMAEISNVETAKLSDLVEIIKSCEPGSDAYCDKGIPFIRVQDFSKEGISEPRQFLEINGKYDKPNLYLKKDTVLFSKDGTVGIAYKIPKNMNAISSSALLHLDIKDNSLVLPNYLALVLNSELVQLQAERDAGGSIINHWRLEEIKEIVVPILPIETQAKISKLVQKSFEVRAQSKQLLEAAKYSVEIAIEEGEEAGLKVCEGADAITEE